MDMTLLIPKNDTLVTYYLLPLVEVNKVLFGRSFKTSYVDRQGDYLYVELKKNMVAPTYKNRKSYMCEIIFEETNTFVKFEVPGKYARDVQFFLSGKYSKMSREAKRLIYHNSSLPYNANMDDFKMTHPILHALGSTATLRDWLVNFLDVKVIPETDELIDKPDETWFIEHRFKL